MLSSGLIVVVVASLSTFISPAASSPLDRRDGELTNINPAELCIQFHPLPTDNYTYVNLPPPGADPIQGYCVQHAPNCPQGKPYPFGCECKAVIKDSKWPNVQLDIFYNNGLLYLQHRNQLNNAFQRTCHKVYDEAFASIAAGNDSNVQTDWHIQDDSYVSIWWRREASAPAELFPYALLSDVVYTIWSWCVNNNRYNTMWIEIWDFRGRPTSPILLGQMGAFKDRIFMPGEETLRIAQEKGVEPVPTQMVFDEAEAEKMFREEEGQETFRVPVGGFETA